LQVLSSQWRAFSLEKKAIWSFSAARSDVLLKAVLKF
jgi:hypothetical protein